MTERAPCAAKCCTQRPDISCREPSTALVVTGAGAVVVGGLVAAITSSLDLARGSWVAAYLVLVVGVAQVAMGLARLGNEGPGRDRWREWSQLAGWNIGSAGVIAGTLAGRAWLVDAGAVLHLAALWLALDAARDRRTVASRPRWLVAYRLLLVILAISIPVGLVLSHVRNP